MAASKRRMLSLEVLETAASGEEERAASGTEALQCWRLDLLPDDNYLVESRLEDRVSK